MVIDQQENTQIEQSPVLKSSADLSQKNKEIDEMLVNSKKDQEMLAVEQNMLSESKTLLQSVNPDSKTLSQDAKVETKTLEQGKRAKTPVELASQEIIKVEAIKDNIKLKEMASIRIAKCESLLNWLKWNRKSNRRANESYNEKFE